MVVMANETSPDRLLKIAGVLEILQVSRSTLYCMMSQGSFPRPLRINLRCVRWRESEVMQWMASRG